MNRWHRDARRFVRRHADALRDRRVWLFSSGPLDDSATAGDIAPVPRVAALLRLVDAHGHTTFGGRLEADARGFVASRMARNTAGDWREPSHIREWAAQIADQLDLQRQ